MYKEDSNRSDQMKEFNNKMAEKLGVTPEKMAVAMQSVRKEWMDQMIAEKIQEAVKNGVITQTEASQVSEWLKNRPQAIEKLIGQMFGHMGGMTGMRMHM